MSDKSIDELESERARIEAEIAERVNAQKQAVIAQIVEVATKYGITAAEINTVLGGPGSKIKPKYRDPATGKTWTGRGMAPLWIRDYSPEDRAKLFGIEE